MQNLNKMEWKKVTQHIEKRNITAVRYPYSTPRALIQIRRESECFFCKKKYEDCEFLGITMSDKGNKICCDDCAKSFEGALANER